MNLREITVNAIGVTWVGVSYACPSCNSIVSVGIDPVALKADLIDEIVERLRGR